MTFLSFVFSAFIKCNLYVDTNTPVIICVSNDFERPQNIETVVENEMYILAELKQLLVWYDAIVCCMRTDVVVMPNVWIL